MKNTCLFNIENKKFSEVYFSFSADLSNLFSGHSLREIYLQAIKQTNLNNFNLFPHLFLESYQLCLAL